MEIAEVRAFPIAADPRPTTKPRVPEIPDAPPIVSPMHRYPGLLTRSRGDWRDVACVVTARDGTWGFGLGCYSAATARIIEDHLGPIVTGENCMATEKLFDAMQRATAHYGTAGLASYAVSAVDMALWDLKGKLLQRPVYELLGGPQKTAIPCYASATGHNWGIENSIEWYLELGFDAIKVFFRHGPEEDMEGLRRNEELVARARELIGDERELIVDAWMSFDVEYVVRLSEALKPYRIKWFEDYVRPEDLGSYVKLRERIPHQILATGEHWYSIPPFAFAAANGLVDIFQPDVRWVGGISAALRICHLAEAHGQHVLAHGGMNYPYGQHLSFAMPAVAWGERSEGVSPPGVPLEEMVRLPGTPVVENGFVLPSDAPGFGLEITGEWLEERAC